MFTLQIRESKLKKMFELKTIQVISGFLFMLGRFDFNDLEIHFLLTNFQTFRELSFKKYPHLSRLSSFNLSLCNERNSVIFHEYKIKKRVQLVFQFYEREFLFDDDAI